jgi:riboflavin kinase/FMN adenylyltransferase
LFKNAITTVGFFDGIHKGHLQIINSLIEKAKKTNGETVIVTLWPHPRTIVLDQKDIKLLSTINEKIELLKQSGIDHVVIIPFSKDIAETSAVEFFHKILIDKIGTKSLMIGFDNHFGKNKEGNYTILKNEANKADCEIAHLEPFFIGEERVSSTEIRLFLELGNIEKANKFLGYQYNISGKVVKGQMLGRTLGFPTANIVPDKCKMIPGIGVYAVLIKVENKTYQGMLNIGFRPTVDKTLLHKTIEANLFNFNDNLYKKEITVTFVARMRNEIKFSGIEELKSRLEKDKVDAQKILNSTNFNSQL